MKRKIIALMLTTAMTAGMFAGCGNAKETGSTDEGNKESEAVEGSEEVESAYGDTYPLQNAEGKSVTYYTRSNNVFSGYADYTESPFHTKLAENVGVDIQFQFDPEGVTDDSNYNLLLTEEVLPDIILNEFSNPQELLDDEIIIPLNDYMEYAPNLAKYLEEHPDVDKAIRTDDGSLYMFPWLREDTWLCTFRGMAVRKDWLDEQGLEVPTTLEELDNVAHIFKEKYGAHFATVVSWLTDGGISTAFDTCQEYYVGDDGNVHYGPQEDGYRDYMKFMNSWFEDGIVDPDIASIDADILKTKVLNDEVGIAYTSGNNVNAWMGALAEAGSDADWVPILNPVQNAGDITMMSQMEQPITGRGAAVTTSCEDIELAMRVLDYAYSEEGFMYYNYGTEGETYTLDENGTPVYTDLIMKDPDGVNNALDKYCGTQWGTAGIQAVNMYKQKNSEKVVNCVDTWTTNTAVAEHKFPKVSPTSEEILKTDGTITSISSYVEEMFYKFLYGEEDVEDDAVWQTYKDAMEGMGLPTVLEVKQAQLDRFNAR